MDMECCDFISVLKNSEPIDFRECEVFDQVAGHGAIDTRLSLLAMSSKNWVLKPISQGEVKLEALREYVFYDYVSKLPAEHVLRRYTSKFYGMANIEHPESASRYFLKLEDLTADMGKHSSIDIKIGTKTYSPTDSPLKKSKIRSKYPLQKQIGMRICGMKVFLPQQAAYRKKDSAWGKDVRPETLVDSLSCFFEETPPSVAAEVVRRFLHDLNQILGFFECQERLLFRSSSIFLAYGHEGGPIKAKVRLIDFCHVFQATGTDDGYLTGLRRLICELEEVQRRVRPFIAKDGS